MRFIIILSVFFFVLTSFGPSQTFPAATVKTLEGKSVEVKDYLGKGTPTVVSFWATWCAPCKRELDGYTELYPTWKQKYNVEVIAISLDNARGLAKVPAMVQSKGWPFLVLTDVKLTLQQALGFQSIPQSFLVDGKGNIVYSHTGYSPGDEFEMEAELKKLTQAAE